MRLCWPVLRSVTSASEVPLARSASSVSRVRRRISALPLLDEEAHLPPAGEADGPGLIVADAELEQPGLAVLDRGERFLDHGPFDAAARYRADKGAGAVDRELAADRPGARAPGLDHGGERHLAPGAHPIAGDAQHILDRCHCITHAAAPESAHVSAGLSPRRAGRLNSFARSARLARLCTGLNSSTCGRIALIPRDLGLKPS